MRTERQAHYLDDENSTILMRQRGIILENEKSADVIDRVVQGIIAADSALEKKLNTEFSEELYEKVIAGNIVFGTPVLTNIGRENRGSAACTVLPLNLRGEKVDMATFIEASKNTLGEAIGTGYDLSELEDPVLALREMNDSINAINIELLEQKKRPTACMATIRADHPEIMAFVSAKNGVDFSKWRFNISAFVTSELFEKAERDELWDLHDNKGKVVKQISARELIHKIAECAHYCGEPGLLFIDRFEADNPTPHWKFLSTAPCAEIALSPGEACQFGYLNLATMIATNGTDTYIDFAKIRATTHTLTRALDNCVEISVKNSPVPLNVSIGKRTIGIGVMGFADLLVQLNIPYNSQQAIDLAAQIGETIEYSSKLASVTLAKSRGTFPAYLESRYQDSAWVKRKLSQSTGVVNQTEWESLFSDISKYGIRNATTTAYPPTGTSSRIVGTTASFEPYLQHVDWRYQDNNGAMTPFIPLTILNHLKKMNPETHRLVNLVQSLYDPNLGHILDSQNRSSIIDTAQDIPYEQHVAIQAAFQAFADAATSKTINLPENCDVADVENVLWLAYTLKLKGITVFRNNCLTQRDITT